jgi:hypothetical protein
MASVPCRLDIEGEGYMLEFPISGFFILKPFNFSLIIYPKHTFCKNYKKFNSEYLTVHLQMCYYCIALALLHFTNTLIYLKTTPNS